MTSHSPSTPSLLTRVRHWLLGSLKNQLILAIVAVHAVMMSIFVADLAARQRAFIQQQQTEEAKTLTRTLALSASSGMLSRDLAGLQELVQMDASDAHVSYVMLVGSEGNVLAHSQRDRIGLFLKDIDTLRQTPRGSATVLNQNAAEVDVAAPVEAAGRVIGWARVGLHRGTSEAVMNAIIRDGLLYTLGAIVIGGLLAFGIGKRLSARLNAIRDTAEAVRSGRTDVRAPVQGEDEAAVVALGLNTMLDTLQADEYELKATQAQLAASSERLELALRGSNDGLWDWDLQTNKVYFSSRWKSMLGHDDNEVSDDLDEWSSRVHPSDLKTCMADVQAHLEGKTAYYENVHRVRHKAGHYLWILDRGLCLRDAAGKAVRMVGTHTDISARVQLERDLSRYKQALDEHAIVSMTDTAGTIVYANTHFSAISGYNNAELIGANHRIVNSGLHPREFFRDMWRTIASGHVWHGEICNRAKNGQPYWVLSTMFPFLDENGQPEHYFSIRADITARKQAEQALYAEKELAQTTLRSIGDGVIATDAHARITFMNPVAEKMTGWHTQEVQGRFISDILKLVNEQTGELVDNPVERCRKERRIVGMSSNTLLVNRTGEEQAIEDSAAPIWDKDGQLTGVVMVFHDVSRQRAMSQQMSWQLTHDALTGLANRTAFEQNLQTLLSDIDLQATHAMLYLDLDQFKVVNETGGHQAGDELLKRLAALMQNHLRHADTLARLGGDEFGVLLSNCPKDKAEEIGEKLRNLVRDFRFGWDDRLFEVGVSIGITTITPGEQTLADVMSAADMACYAAKEMGRNRVHLHDPGDADTVHRRQMLQAASGIRAALEEERFQLYAQEIRPLQAELHGHYEVLIRMLDEEGKILSPAVFIPAAERFGLMGEIDRWVVKKAFAALKENADIHLAINLSGLSLQSEGVVEFVRATLDETGIDPARVCFEITETAAISNLGRAQVFLREMKALGFSFSLDDFGSGMSSFAYLKSLPVDYLKIDGAFVRDIATDPIDHAFVEAINRIGQVMGKQTIAEYVENNDITEKLIQIGVNYAQGYGIAKPAPLDSLLSRSATSP